MAARKRPDLRSPVIGSIYDDNDDEDDDCGEYYDDDDGESADSPIKTEVSVEKTQLKIENKNSTSNKNKSGGGFMLGPAIVVVATPRDNAPAKPGGVQQSISLRQLSNNGSQQQ